MLHMKVCEENPDIISIDRRDIERRDNSVATYEFDRRQKDRRKRVSVPLAIYIKQKVEQYFTQLNGHDPVGLHAMVISEVERPLLEAALEYSGHNQTKAAKALGLSRSTLRKKMEDYGIS
jgi:Fis family transcriptional regulator, factor for inversion stimulation protein